MYADNSVELRRKSELSQESAVAACRVYVPYISDIIRQLDEVMKIFAIEKELRTIKNRGYFPVPQITPQDSKIETARDKDKVLETIDEIATAMIKAVRQSEENYLKNKNKQEQEMNNLGQLDKLIDQASTNFTPANSTPIRNHNTRTDTQGVHFNTNPTCHIYPAASDSNNHYEPPENDSIIKTAMPPQANNLQLAQPDQQVAMHRGDTSITWA